MKKNIIKNLLLVTALAVMPASFSSAKIDDQNLKTLFIDLNKVVNPAVVNIFTTQIIRNPYGGGFQGIPMDPFDQLFEQFYGGGLGGMPREQKAASLGSGFIIDETGIIVTNNHVIQNATDIQVQLTEKSKRKYKAKVVGKDEKSDIALIKIDAGKLPTLALGDSDKVQVGEWVAAFGNPFGHGHTMTKGIISAKDRDVEVENAPNFPFLQTDAGINPGNSGGPLVNTEGEAIGINSAIDPRATGGPIGFAIPINVVKKLLPELKAKGHVTRGFLGVGSMTVDDRIAKEMGLSIDKGAIITSIVPGSPAERAGMRPYDVIVEFNGKPVDDARELANVVADTRVGDTVTAKVFREGKKVSLKVSIMERNDNMLAQMGREPRPQTPFHGQTAPHDVGITVTDLNPMIGRQLGLPPQIKHGAVIINVAEGSIAEQAGLQVGDLVLDVNQKFKNHKQPPSAKEIVGAFKKGNNSLLVQRGGNTMLVFLGGE